MKSDDDDVEPMDSVAEKRAAQGEGYPTVKKRARVGAKNGSPQVVVEPRKTRAQKAKEDAEAKAKAKAEPKAKGKGK